VANGLTKWFKENWVDIGAPKKKESFKNVEDPKVQDELIPNVFLLLKQQE